MQARLQQSAERAREALQQTRQSVYQTTGQDRRIAEALDHLSDPDYLGGQAEQRFYAEQDPASQWYREDLYHGEPGPDVAIDRAEQEMRQRAHDMEESQRGAHYEQTRTALQDALGEALERLHDHHPHSAEYLDAAAHAAELRQALQDLDRAEHHAQEVEFERQELAYDESQLRIAAGEPPPWEQACEDRPYDLMEEQAHDGEEMERRLPYDTIVVDTSNPTMEEDFQALLARMDQRLDALVKETEPETQQLQQKQGVRY